MKKSLLAISFLLAALPAQDASPFRFAPADSAFVVRIGAPAKWKQRFARTDIAKVLQGPNVGPIIAELTKQFEQGMSQVRESGKFDPELMDKFLSDYKGDMVLAMQLDMDGLMAAMENDDTPPMSFSFALTPDGTFDLAALGKEFAKMAEDSGEQMREVTVDDQQLRFGGDDVQVALPTMIDGHLVMFGANDLEKSVGKLLSGDRFQHAAAKGNPPLFAHVQAGAMIDKMLAFASEQGGVPIDIRKVFELMGLSAVDHGTIALDADGKHVAGEMSLSLRGSELGIWGAMMANKAPKLLRYVPANASNFTVAHFDVAKFYEVIGKVWGEFEQVADVSFEDAQQMFAEKAKIALKADLIDHFGDEMISLQNPAATADDDDEDPMTAALGASCVGMSLRNGKALGESLDKMLRSLGMHAGRKTEDYQGNKVHRLALGGLIELEYAVTDDLLLLAIGKGESARQSLRTILDTRATPLAEGELPASAKALAQALPPGWAGLGAGAMGPIFLVMADTFDMAASQADEDVPEEVESVMELFRALAKDLEALKVQMVTATYATAKGVQLRFRM